MALAKTGTVAGLAPLVDEGGAVSVDTAQAVYPMLVQHVMPAGLRVLVVASLLAALMSSLAAALNASSTLFTMDFYQPLRPAASQARLVWVGRAATTVMVATALLWIPVIQGARGLYEYLQGVQAYLAPPIFAVFVFGVTMKRVNAAGCLAALVIGFALGAFRLLVDTPVTLQVNGYAGGYTEGSLLWIVHNIYFQYYSVLIFLVSAAALLGVSWATTPPSERQLTGLTFGTITGDQRTASRASWNAWDVAASVVVLAGIGAAYAYFTG